MEGRTSEITVTLEGVGVETRPRGYGGFEPRVVKDQVQQEEGWEVVQRRRRTGTGRSSGYVKPDIVQAKSYGGRDQQQSTTFYISNFMEEVDAKYLFKILGCYGELQEVVIPARRNRLG